MQHFRNLAATLVVLVLGVGDVCADPRALESADHHLNQSRSEAMSINQFVVNYLACWNERDPAKRKSLVEKTWSTNGTYTDPHRNARGAAALDAMLAKAQESFPGYRVRLISRIETHNGYVRFSWAAGGVDDAPLYLGGTDMVTVGADGRAEAVVGFVDATPAPQ
jgi:hypothetical protein